jgi:hypothetical protein
MPVNSCQLSNRALHLVAVFRSRKLILFEVEVLADERTKMKEIVAQDKEI